MRNFKFLAVMMLLLSVAATQSFGQKTKGKTQNKSKMEMKSAIYACPMHAEVTGKMGEKCSKCGMALVEKKSEAKKEMASSKYICPMKCEGSASDKPGDCPKCGMKLVANDSKKEDHSGHKH